MRSDQQPLISIIIVNWNGAKWVKACLDSLVGQNYANLEIITVDNASTDNSLAIIKDNYPDVKLVYSPENTGFAGGNNQGIAAAKGSLILLINSDTWVDKTFVSDLYEEYTRRGLDVIAPREADYVTRANRHPYVTTIDYLGHPLYMRDPSLKKECFYLPGVSLLFTKQLYIETGGLDPEFFMYCEEVDWFWRLAMAGKKYAFADKTAVYHAAGGSTGTGIKANVFLWRNQNTLQMLIKNYASRNLIWVLPIYMFQNLLEMMAFLLMFKPKIAATYIEGWKFNIKNFNSIIARRKQIQKERILPDSKVMRSMYHGSAKFIHILKYSGIRKTYGS